MKLYKRSLLCIQDNWRCHHPFRNIDYKYLGIVDIRKQLVLRWNLDRVDLESNPKIKVVKLHPKNKIILLRCILQYNHMLQIRVACLNFGLSNHILYRLMGSLDIDLQRLSSIYSTSKFEFSCSFHIVIRCKQGHIDCCTRSTTVNRDTNHNSMRYNLFRKVCRRTSLIHYSIC